MTDAYVKAALVKMGARDREALAVEIGVSSRTIHRWAAEGLSSKLNPLVRDALEKALGEKKR